MSKMDNIYCCKKSDLQQTLRDYINYSSVDFNYAATLTTQNDIKNIESLKKNGQRFLRRYNNELGFRNYKRKVKYDPTQQAPMVAVIEGNGKKGQNGKKYHYHLALHKPDNLSDAEFEVIVKKCWRESNDGNVYKSDVRPMYDFGWIEYITKDITRNNTDALDIERTHIY